MSFLVLISQILFSQDFSKDYTPIQNAGRIPRDILTSSTMKYKRKKNTISSKDKRKVKKVKKQFYLKSAFAIDELLHSGKVLFSDKEVTEYVNDVADELLKDNPSLRKKLHFYTVKSPVANAFATDRGAIFFTMGLLAKLDNEAELAFILSHEIAHVTEKHSLNAAVTFDKIDRGKRKISFRKSNSYDPLLKKSNYSKENEQDADLLGGQRYLKTAYNPQGMLDVFDVLEYAHVHLNNEIIEDDFLDLDGLRIPRKYFRKEIDKPEPLGDDNEYSTHPNIDERRSKAEKLLAKNQKRKGKDYIVSEDRFRLAKATAQFELCNIFLQQSMYPEAVYYSTVLLEKYPENIYLKNIKTYGLYGMAQYSNADRADELTKDDDEVQGNIRQVHTVLAKLANNSKGINLVAARYCWDSHLANPADKGMEMMLRDQVEDMMIYAFDDDDKKYFSDSRLAKADSIKDFGLLAFAEIRKEKDFEKMVKDGIFYRKKNEENEYRKPEKIRLGRRSALFINPLYYRMDVQKGVADVEYVYSELRQKEFKKIIKRNSRRVGLKTKILDSHDFKSKNTEDFNDLVMFSDFEDELFRHNMYMIVSSYNRIQPLVKKYNTSTVVTTGNLSLRKGVRIIGIPKAITYTIFPPVSAMGIRNLGPKYLGMHYAFVFDIESNQILMKDVKAFGQKDNTAMMELNMYNTMYKIKTKKKKKK